MFDIAYHGDGQPAQVKTIAARQGVPIRFLEQIFLKLKRADLVSSRRGPRGGYALSQPASAIQLGVIIRALEGATSFRSADADAPDGDSASREITERMFDSLAEAVDRLFDGHTLADLCDQAEEAGVRRGPPRRYVYSI